jgi:hypothetical protein
MEGVGPGRNEGRDRNPKRPPQSQEELARGSARALIRDRGKAGSDLDEERDRGKDRTRRARHYPHGGDKRAP